MTFDSFNFHPRIISNINTQGFKTPTPIQLKSIPVVLKGQDMIGLAQTGTGKTAAFVLPILQQLLSSEGDGQRGRPRALIIAPTRELAQQTQDTINKLGQSSGIRSVAVYGGVSINPQIQKLHRGVDIVVACPGRLLDHLGQGTIHLSNIEILVLDEADQMFDMGFLPNIRQILRKLPQKRQSLLFSATMPKDIRQLADEILNRPVNIQIANNAPAASVTQSLYPITQQLKTDLVIKILQTISVKSVLIFTRTKQRAKHVADQLSFVGYTATSMQGGLSQSKRQKALDDFRKGKLKVLVATDLASRGIDVEEISLVINYDMPDTVEAYTHRIGRTGRAAKLGEAFTFVMREDMGRVRAIEKVLGSKLERRVITDFDYEAKSTLPPVPKERPLRGAPSAHRRSSSSNNTKPGGNSSFSQNKSGSGKPSFSQKGKPGGAGAARGPKKGFKKFSPSKNHRGKAT